MSYLIDTNIISEVRKGSRCHPNVAAWFASVTDDELYMSVLVLGEIRKGIERLRPNSPAQAVALESWLEEISESYGDRVLSIERLVVNEWGRMSAMRTVSIIDALLAATAKVHGMTLVTRNISDVAALGADLLNPFEFVAD